MSSALIRKARHLIEDPVLRQWLIRHLTGLERSPRAFVAGAPPYMTVSRDPKFVKSVPRWTGNSEGSGFSAPNEAISIELPGETVTLSPGDPGELFDRTYHDLETLLAAYRFAWVPLAGPTVNTDWVNALWSCWAEKFGTRETGWAWHAYTAAERAINIIDFAQFAGLPGDEDLTIALLLKHAVVIRNNLEYFGDHYTSNHLSNNGRGLLRIGIALDVEEFADVGAKIMIAEAGRIFGRSGVLREGSSHYHLLATRNYLDAWLAVDAAGFAQASLLRDVAERALAAVSGLCLPGGMPLIGDISPDAPQNTLQR